MKIVTWNCETAGNNLIDKVIDHVNCLNADIIALQETKNETTKNGNTLWDNETSLGDIWTENGNKRMDNYSCGVSLFAKNAKVERLESNDEVSDFTFVVLYKVTQPNGKILYVFNVWLKMFNGTTKIQYMERLKKALLFDNYTNILENYPTVILGDFNVYDSESHHKEWLKWIEISRDLSEKYGIESAWHTHNHIEFGKEGDELTLLHYAKYHCDFCLYSKKHFNLTNSYIDKSVIENKLSDHNPVITELEWK